MLHLVLLLHRLPKLLSLLFDLFSSLSVTLIIQRHLLLTFSNHSITLRTNCLLDFVHRTDEIYIYKITTFRKLFLLPSSGEGKGDTY
jgi:hypothetical protein